MDLLVYSVDGKHLRLIVRQFPINSGWGNAHLTIQDLAEAIFLDIARNTGTFSGYHLLSD